jgi:prevent-host-death family protein
MTTTTLSSREFNQDTARAKRAAQEGPVFITDRGKPVHVLMTIAEYQRLAGKNISLAEALEQKGDEGDFDFDPTKLGDSLFKSAKLD